MSKKSLVVILILSVVVTYGAAYLDFVFNVTTGQVGLPFGFSRFNFFGAETDKTMLLLDIAFWFMVIWIIWKVILKVRH
ncbi:MAG: hypothetical protein Q8Q91_00910 [Candidatus Daviesbacteria bacterium]|nr:hypothetical protein [Candidatus Daviesbacteria bacterium]